MRTLCRLALTAWIFLGLGNAAIAAPFEVTWNGVIGVSAPTYNSGEAMSVTIVLDNGGTDAISQTWDSSHVVSVIVELNNGAITTVFGGTGFNLTTGVFSTDATGALTAVPSSWGSRSPVINLPVISTNDPLGSASVRWVIDGAGGFVYQNGTAPARATNSATNITTAGWSNPVALGGGGPTGPGAAAIPTMSVYGLVLTALGVLLLARRRLAV